MRLKQDTVVDSLNPVEPFAPAVAVLDNSVANQKVLTLTASVTAERSPVRVDAYFGRALRISGLAGAMAILFFHANGILLNSILASAVLAFAFFLLALSALPPLHDVRLRDALREDRYALSPVAREIAQVAFNILVALGLLIEPLQQHASIKGSLILAVPLLLMSCACTVRVRELWPRKASRR